MDRLKDAEACGRFLRLRLGHSSKTWGDNEASVAAMITRETIGKVRESFVSLEPSTKIRLMLTLTQVPAAKLSELGDPFEELLVEAVEDADEWVKVMGQVVKDHSRGLPLHTSLAEKHDAFKQALATIKESAANFKTSRALVPLETVYLHEKLVAEHMRVPKGTTEFTLKKKPRPATADSIVVYKAVASDNAGGGPSVTSRKTKGAGGFSSKRRTSVFKPSRRTSSAPAQQSRREILARVQAQEAASSRSNVITLSVDQLPVHVREKDRKRKGAEEVDPNSAPATPTKKRKVGDESDAAGYEPGASTDEPTGAGPAPGASTSPTHDPAPDYAAATTPPHTDAPADDTGGASYNPTDNTGDDANPGAMDATPADAAPTATGAAEPEPEKPNLDATGGMEQKDWDAVFEKVNRLSAEDRPRIEEFMRKNDVAPTVPGKDVEKIVLNEDRNPVPGEPTLVSVEQILFEMTFSTRQWRRLKRKRKIKAAPAPAPS